MFDKKAKLHFIYFYHLIANKKKKVDPYSVLELFFVSFFLELYFVSFFLELYFVSFFLPTKESHLSFLMLQGKYINGTTIPVLKAHLLWNTQL